MVIKEKIKHLSYQNRILQLCYNYLQLIKKTLQEIPLVIRRRKNLKKSLIDNRVLMMSWDGKSYSDNIKALGDYIYKNNVNLDVFIGLTSSQHDLCGVPKNFHIVIIGTEEFEEILYTSKFVISNTRIGFYYKRRKEQIYIQTWHGVAIKQIESAVKSSLKPYYIRMAKRDSSNISYMVSNCRVMTEQYRKFMWYDGEILEFGFPRNDVLFVKDNNYIYKVKASLGLKGDEKVVLYAPTFRENTDSISMYKFDHGKLLATLEKRFGSSWKLITRLHPNIANKLNIADSNNNELNGSMYPNMQELLLISDVLITDYSSCILDFVLTKRPAFIFATDIEEYNRGFAINLENLPFPIGQTEKDLFENIETFDEMKYKKDLQIMHDNFHFIDDGCASQRVVSYMTRTSHTL